MTESENLNPMTNDDDLDGLKTKLLATDTRLQLTATELRATQVELEATKQELETARQSHASLDASLVASVTSFARPTTPDGWLLCDGQAISRSAYARLFEAIGTIYGEGDGSNTFNLPDMRGLFVRGHDPIGKNDSQRKFASYQEDQIQSHIHTDSGHSHSGDIGSDGNHSHSANTSASGSHSHSGSTSYDGSHSHYLNKYSDGEAFKALGFSERNRNNSNPSYSGKILTSFADGNAPLNVNCSTRSGYGDYFSECDSAGYHSHSLSINSADSHTHSVTVNSTGSHSHSISINNGQANLSNPTNARHGSETRVKNLALIYCIKY